MFEFLNAPGALSEALISLLTLTALEIVLGIDNIVFISILAAKLPRDEQVRARRLGLMAALGSRIILLMGIAWIVKLTTPLFTILDHPVSIRDLILIAGGLFLIAKATYEIYHKVEGVDEIEGQHGGGKGKSQLSSILVQIAIVDLVFSLDSVITAVGMAKHLPIMIAAVIISVITMMIFAKAIGDFIEKRPSIKILALSFLVMIGVLLVGEGMGEHLNKGYVYFGMAFALFIEVLNMRYSKKAVET